VSRVDFLWKLLGSVVYVIQIPGLGVWLSPWMRLTEKWINESLRTAIPDRSIPAKPDGSDSGRKCASARSIRKFF
jgi:hypothetical protein